MAGGLFPKGGGNKFPFKIVSIPNYYACFIMSSLNKQSRVFQGKKKNENKEKITALAQGYAVLPVDIGGDRSP